MRKVILQVAVSLDNFIEGPNGEYDWCFTDQDYGMTNFLNGVDAMFIGRKSYELTLQMGEAAMAPFAHLATYVFSNSLTKVKNDAHLVDGDIEAKVKQLKNEPGKDIWLFGGAGLTTSLLNLRLVDEMRLAVHPLILGKGKPLFSSLQNRVSLTLTDTKTYSTGLVMLTYQFN